MMTYWRSLLAVTCICSACSSYAAGSGNLLAVYRALDEMCRGGSGDDPRTDQACDARNKASAALKDAGFCFKGVGADSHWVKCR